jgi:hypothetical protein
MAETLENAAAENENGAAALELERSVVEMPADAE